MKWYQLKQNWIKVAGFCLLFVVIAGLIALINYSYHHPKTIERNAQHAIVQQVETRAPEITAINLHNALGNAGSDVVRFYEQRQWQSLWNDGRITALLLQIKFLKGDGLEPEDYSLTELENTKDTGGDQQRFIQRELLATRAYLLALRHLSRGKTNPAEVEPLAGFMQPVIDEEALIRQAREAVENDQIDIAFDAARPAINDYNAIRSTLTGLRRLADDGGWPVIPEGKAMKPGKKDPRIPLLRQRLQASGLLENTTGTGDTQHSSDATYFDKNLANAVKHFQQLHLLNDDGIVGKSTLQALNVPVAQRIDQLRANLERLRWRGPETLPQNNDYVLVDIAAFRIAYMRNNTAVWQSRIQVGKPSRPTPVLQSTIGHITLNPQWSVPPTILRKDVLPAIRKDLAYLAEHHIRVFNLQGKELAPETVYWDEPGPVVLRQDAGADASLGQLAIRFPNTHSVYLHETPHQELFRENTRAFSSGCIRVENVRELAVLLLNNEKKWSRAALEAEIAKGITRDAGLKTKIPVIIIYRTARTAEDGSVQFMHDIYQKDAAILAALDKPAS